MPVLRLLLLLTALCLALPGQPTKTVFIITDVEGLAGVCRQEQAEPTNTEMRALLAAEVNAAVRGFFDAGADEVLVWDGHDGSRSMSVLTIDPRAKLVMGALGPTMLMERRFAAVAFVGQHARANRGRAVMAHSYSSLGLQRITMNGQEVGEIETRTALAGWFGTPVILLTGDQAAAEDLRAIVPEAEMAVVKESLGYYSCISLSAEAAQTLIAEKATAAFRKIGQIKPYRIDGPVTIEIERTTRSTPLPDTPLPPGAEFAGPRTERFHGKDFMEAWMGWQSR